MVYLHFPSNLTEEELMLQAKYAKLKKKKKALQALKAPKPEPEKPLVTKRSGAEARDAREIARKLLKSGAIQAIKSPPPLPQNATFKRPRAGRERKLSGPSSSGGAVASYQPFSVSQEPPLDEKAAPRVKHLYDSFVTSRDSPQPAQPREEKPPPSPTASPPRSPERPRPAAAAGTCTLLVSGVRSEQELRRRVATYRPHHVLFQQTAEKGYVTLDSPETAARALTDLDGSPGEDGAALRACYSRRAPPSPPPPPAHPPPPAPPRDANRSLLTYDDIFE